MRAALLHTYGDPVEPGERPDPQQAEDRVLLRVTAAPIVPLDLLCAGGTSYFGQQPLPYVPGVQGVGMVADTGVRTGPSSINPETRVWFATSAGMTAVDGSWAEWCSVKPEDLVPITADVPDPLVAAIGTSGIAAWMALTWRAALQPGERVVVLGATGVVGRAAVAIARHLGAGRIVGVSRREVRGLPGADDVVVFEPGADRAANARALSEAAGGPVDVIIDPVFGEPAAAAALALGPGGRLVNLGATSGDLAEFSSAALRGRMIDLLGYTNNAISPEQRADALTQVLALAESGSLVIDREVRGLSDCRAAWSAAGTSRRRIVLDPTA